MAQPRLQLHDILKAIVENVYFQPPPSLRMTYPCIVYALDGASVDRANNELYRHAKKYQITVIDRNPDTALADQVQELHYCSFERFFAVDDLNHYVFSLYF